MLAKSVVVVVNSRAIEVDDRFVPPLLAQPVRRSAKKGRIDDSQSPFKTRGGNNVAREEEGELLPRVDSSEFQNGCRSIPLIGHALVQLCVHA